MTTGGYKPLPTNMLYSTHLHVYLHPHHVLFQLNRTYSIKLVTGVLYEGYFMAMTQCLASLENVTASDNKVVISDITLLCW